MKKGELKRTAFVAALFCLLALLSVSVVTFAWFTAANRVIETGKVRTNTSSSELRLAVSRSGNPFREEEDCKLVQQNRTDASQLLPVSTDDLANFVYCPVTDANEQAAKFYPVTDESYFYHGAAYLKAELSNLQGSSRVFLYFDGTEKGGSLLSNLSGDILNAARLGLVLTPAEGAGAGEMKILSLSTLANAEGRKMNTLVNGTAIAEGQVLHSDSSGSIRNVADPSVLYSDYFIGADGAIPKDALFEMLPGQVYRLDVYFYLEGCDPDCIEVISLDAVDLALYFYGQLAG